MSRKYILLFLIGVFSANLFGGSGASYSFKDTDELIKNRKVAWLSKIIAPMSAKDQLESINEFKGVVTAYRQTTKGYILPLGPQSKEKLREMSSWLYSNLVAESFNQKSLPDIIECAISLSDCSFSAHYLFDAFEYQLWTYNHKLLNDLDYTRLFFAMSQSKYFPNQSGYNLEQQAYSHPGFDIHEHLGEIVANQKQKIGYAWLGYGARKSITQTLANIVIAYNMMIGEEFDSIEGKFQSLNMTFPLDGAVSALVDLFDKCTDSEKEQCVKSIQNSKNLYKSLLLGLICKTEMHFPARACLDPNQPMPSEALEKHRKLVLDIRKILNNGSNNAGAIVSGFEASIGNQLFKLHTSKYNVKHNVYDSDLCSEIDFVITNVQTGTVLRIEADGPFHFNQNFHGNGITQDLNGLTRLQTNLLRKFGKVLRISGACDSVTYHKRIDSIVSVIKAFDASSDRERFIPASGEYASCLK